MNPRVVFMTAAIRRIPRMLAFVLHALNKYMTQRDAHRRPPRCATMRR